MNIEIQDDFDLNKISLSGQCFRVKLLEGDIYRFVTGNHVVYIKSLGKHQFSVSCGIEEWNEIWGVYFDIGRCYSSIFEKEHNKHPFIHAAMNCGRGLRILKQDSWEMLITFIISQRKNIPSIAKAVEMLASRYGRRIETKYETLYSFPSPQEMACASLNELQECGLGYRSQFILDAIHQILSGTINLNSISVYNDEQLLETLQTIRGVGKKVANCVALFAYGRTACVPIDVWIARAIKNDCGGESPFGLFQDNAGIIQQYIFYYEKHHQTTD